MTRDEMQQLINELIDERQELSLTVDKLADDNHTLRQRNAVLEAENAAQRDKLKRRSKTVKMNKVKVKEELPRAIPQTKEVLRAKDYKPDPNVSQYYKAGGKYFRDK